MGLRRRSGDGARPSGGAVLRRPLTARTRLAALAAALLAFLLFFVLSGSVSAHRVRDWMDGFGLAGPLVFVVVSSALTVVLFPGPVLSGASGLLFGTALGTPVSIVAATCGAALAFSVSRWWAHDAVAGHPRLSAPRAWVARRGFESVLLARIAPGVPYNLVNYAAGLTPVGLGVFAGATAIGVAPRAFAYTALGGSIGNLTSTVAVVAYCLLAVEGAIGVWLMRRGYRGRNGQRGEDRDRREQDAVA